MTWNNASVTQIATYTYTPLILSTPLVVFPWWGITASLSKRQATRVGQAGSFSTAHGDPTGPIQATKSFQPHKIDGLQATITRSPNPKDDGGRSDVTFGYIPQNLIDWLKADKGYVAQYPQLASCLPGGPFQDALCALVSPIVAEAATDLTGSSTVSMTSTGCFHPGACAAAATTTTPVKSPMPTSSAATVAAALPDSNPGTPTLAVNPSPTSSQGVGAAIARPFQGPQTAPSVFTNAQISAVAPEASSASNSAANQPTANQQPAADSPPSISPAANVANSPAQNSPAANQPAALRLTANPSDTSQPAASNAGSKTPSIPPPGPLPEASQLPSLTISIGSSASNVVVNGVTSDLRGNTLSPLPNAPSAPAPTISGIESSSILPSHNEVANPANALAPIVVGSQTFTANQASLYIIGSQTLAPGSSAVVIPGSAVYKPSPNQQASKAYSPITVGGQIATPDPTSFSIGGAVVSAGGPQVTVAGTPMSLGSSGVLAVGSSTTTLLKFNGNVTSPSPATFTGKASSDRRTGRIVWSITIGVMVIVSFG